LRTAIAAAVKLSPEAVQAIDAIHTYPHPCP
jgi:hypothetical protein